MSGVLTAPSTKLLKCQPFRRRLFILGGRVISALTLGTLKDNLVAHEFNLRFGKTLLPTLP